MATTDQHPASVSTNALDSANSFDDFGDIEQALPLVRPSDERGPMLQWLNGNPAVMQPAKEGEQPIKTVAVGFFVKCGEYPDLDVAMEQIGAPRYTIQYKSVNKQTGKPNKEESWHLNPCTIFPLCQGVLSIYEMQQDPRRIGLAYGREKERNDDGSIKRDPATGDPTDHPKLMLKVLVQELLAVGYTEPVLISLRGMICFEMIAALKHHLKAVDAYNSRIRQQRHGKLAQARQLVQTGQMTVQQLQELANKPIPTLPFAGLSVPLIASEEQKWVGRQKKSPIYPIVADIPSPITDDYLLAHRMLREVLQWVMEEGGLLQQCVAWSIEQSQRIPLEGPEEHAPGITTVSEEPLEDDTVPGEYIEAEADALSAQETASLSAAEPGDDPLVIPAQIAWIERVFCHNNAEAIAQVCRERHVQDLKALHKSDFLALVELKRQQGE
jgi:hypothetical protein